MMKYFKIWIGIIVTILMVAYLFGSFLYASFDISLWEDRQSFIGPLSVVLLGGSFIYWIVAGLFWVEDV